MPCPHRHKDVGKPVADQFEIGARKIQLREFDVSTHEKRR